MDLYYNDKFICKTSADKLFTTIKTLLNGNGIENIPYYRCFQEGDTTVIDYGSHVNFFYIKYDEGDV